MKLLYILVLLAIVAVPIVSAADTYKPYLHKPQVPEAPKVRLFGAYQTDLFPGAATYTYPIDVPPGTHGLQPSLSLIYSSQGAKGRPGILGAGWEFTHDYIIKNLNGTISDTTDDFYTLFLNGRMDKLVINGTELKTEIDYGARIDAHLGANTTIGTYWVVTTKDGTQYRFGYTSDSELENGISTIWNLDEAKDTYGNIIDYDYLQNPNPEDAGASYLYQIRYNRDNKRVVKLYYENNVRPDQRQIVREGGLFEESRRLSSIEIVADEQFVRRYAFTYTNLSLSATALSTIKQYGNDNTSLLHTVTFTYNTPQAGYSNQTSSWIGPSIFASSTSVDFGVRSIDVNNDGFVDFLHGRASTSEKNTFLSNKQGNWTNSTSFHPPVYFVYGASDLDNGVRFADIDADGRLDIIQSSNNGAASKNVFINNDTSWINRTSSWTIPVYFVSSDVDQGTEFVDVNGDGKTDIIQANNASGNVYLNTGSGWTSSTIWQFPTVLINTSTDAGARVVDLNGDGLPDIIRSSPAQQQAWLNNGSGWVITSSWAPPVQFVNSTPADTGVRLADVNGDGLVDLVQSAESDSSGTAWLNNGSGWSQDASWRPPEPFIIAGKNTGRRLADADGDGLADEMITIGNGTLQQGNTYTKINGNGLLLKTITNEYGGIVSINYTSSTQFDNTGGDGISDLGFAVNVVKFVDKNNTMSGTFNIFATTNYNYSGGLYDAEDVQFRGFSNVTETLPDATIVKHHFYQDDPRKGKEFKTETYSSQGALLSIGLMNYSSTYLAPNYRVVLDSSTIQQYDGNSVPFETRTLYGYDQYMNLVEKDNVGNVADSQDDRIEKYEYEYAIGAHIVDRPIKYTLLSSDNVTKVKESTFSYDEGIITKGGLTRQEDWNDRGDNSVNHYSYDDYGNRISMTDSLGRTTLFEYGLRDSTFTFVDRMTNALNHKTEYSYDLGTGNLISQTQNEITTSFQYDAFGRIVKEIQPYDSGDLPTKQYNYSFDGMAPETVSMSLRETANVKNKALQYNYDGFAQVVQIRSEADNNEFVVKNVYYDGLGRVFKEDNPYFGTPWFQLPANGTPFTNYSYDGLGRVFLVQNPDGTNKSITFNKTAITDFDENGHKHAYHLDGFGQIVKVQEFNNDPLLNLQLDPYNTTYEYDDQGNLVKITDTEGHEFKFAYDSLGRKVQLDDPDLGRWTYAYDVIGNLVRQTDNRGKSIDLSYDTLNRITKKNATTGIITFAYDAQFEGTLSNISSVNGTVKRYTYDDRMRITQEEVLMRSVWRTTGFTYDSMNRILEQTLPSEVLEYYYGKQGMMQKIPGYIDASTYNAFGSLLMRNYTTGRVQEFTYNDTNNRLVMMTNGLAQNIRYGFDAVGNVLKINDTVNNRYHALSYDNLDRLSSAILNGETYKYEYDALGRIQKTQENNLIRRYNYLGAQAHAPSDIITRAPDAAIHNAQDLDTDSKNRVYEFYLVNETGTTTSQNWSVKVAGSTVTSNQFNLSSPVMVLVEYNQTSGGTYAVNVTTKNDSSVFSDTFGLAAEDVEALSQNGSRSISEFVISNDVAQSITGVNWTCGTISASQTATISGNSQMMVFVEQNYSASGVVSLNCSAKSNDGNDSETATFNLNGLSVEDLNTISNTESNKILSFNLFNYHDPTTLTFNTSTGENLLKNSSSLATGAMVMVIEEVNYSQDGAKNITISAGSNILNETAKENLLLEALKLRYDRYDDNTSRQIEYFTVDNDWVYNLTVNFTASAPSINNNSNVGTNKTVMVILEESYSGGQKSPLFTALAQNFTATLRDLFRIVPVDLLNYEILQQNKSSTIAQFDIRNNDNATNVSWRMDTGQGTVYSNITASLNHSKDIFVFVEMNYTTTGVYATTGTANSSSSSDNSTGVAVI